MNDELAMAIHKKYKEGKYSLPQKDISELNLFLRKYFKEEEKILKRNNDGQRFVIFFITGSEIMERLL